MRCFVKGQGFLAYQNSKIDYFIAFASVNICPLSIIVAFA